MPAPAARRHARAADTLLALALSRPADALIRAQEVLAGRPAVGDAAVAHQALGIVRRDQGDTATAKRELRRALRLERRAGGHPERIADVLASLGTTHALAGNVRAGLALLSDARSLVPRRNSGRVLTRLGYVLALAGRHEDARTVLNEAVLLLHRARDGLWEARARTHRGLGHLVLGDTRRADSDFEFAEGWFAAADQQFEHAMARHNRGLTAAAAGQLPRALTLFHEARQRYEELNVLVPELAVDECTALMAAGFARDALLAADQALKHLTRSSGHASIAAELSLVAGRAALAAAEPALARERAEHARRLFTTQRRELWTARARMLRLEAEMSLSHPTLTTARTASEIAAQLSRLSIDESTRAHLLAARVSLAVGRTEQAIPHLDVAARSRFRGSAIDRVTGWVAQALLCEVRGSRRAMLAACRRGLDVLEQHRLTLGATEARATATSHGRALAHLALRSAVARGDPRLALRWNARLRSTTWLPPASHAAADSRLLDELSALREVSRRLAVHSGDEARAQPLRRQRDDLERSIRSRVLRSEGTSATTKSARPPANASESGWWAGVEGAFLLELFEVDEALYAVTAHHRRVRLHHVGSSESAALAIAHTHALLRRIARGRHDRHGQSMLNAAGRELQSHLLGSAAGEFERSRGGDMLADVVIVGTARLYAAPWTLVPALTGRAVSLSPSSQARAPSLAPRRADNGLVVLASGPSLSTRGGELGPLVVAHGAPTVLQGADATAERVLSAMDGAALVHVAAHGVFRSDNPQFSSLLLADGPLTVFDLERLRQPPRRVILASCDSGRMAPVGSDDLLGLVTCLISLGAEGVMAPISPVNDEATVAIMVAVHERLARGLSLPEAARQARILSAGDPLATATAASFLVFGR